MAATKTLTTLQSSVANTAGSTTTSSSATLTTAYGAVVTGSIANGGSAPTLPGTATVNISGDGSTWRQWAVWTAGLATSTTYTFAIEVPPATMYAQIVFSGNTGQSVTVIGEIEILTGL